MKNVPAACQKNWWKLFKSSLKKQKNINVILYVFINLRSGNLSFPLFYVFKNFITCAYGIQYVGYTMICYGVATCLASFLIQGIVRKTGYLSVIMTGYVVLMGLFVWIQLWDVIREPKWVGYLTTFLLGASEIAVTSQAHGKGQVVTVLHLSCISNSFKGLHMRFERNTV